MLKTSKIINGRFMNLPRRVKDNFEDIIKMWRRSYDEKTTL